MWQAEEGEVTSFGDEEEIYWISSGKLIYLRIGVAALGVVWGGFCGAEPHRY